MNCIGIWYLTLGKSFKCLCIKNKLLKLLKQCHYTLILIHFALLQLEECFLSNLLIRVFPLATFLVVLYLFTFSFFVTLYFSLSWDSVLGSQVPASILLNCETVLPQFPHLYNGKNNSIFLHMRVGTYKEHRAWPLGVVPYVLVSMIIAIITVIAKDYLSILWWTGPWGHQVQKLRVGLRRKNKPYSF